MNFVPSLGGNWVDLGIIAILLFFLIEGLSDRFLPAFFNLLGFIFTYAFALKFYGIASKLFIANFSLPHGIANALGFFAVALVVEFTYNVLISLLYERIPLGVKNSKLNRTFGFLPAIGNGVLLVAFVLTLFIALPTAPSIKKDILESKIGSLLVLRTQAVEQAIDSVFGQAVNETLTFLTVEPRSQERVDLKFTTSNFAVDSLSEATMLTLVNQERTRQGFKVLEPDRKLQVLARSYAEDMLKRGYFSHYNPEGLSPFDRMQKAGVSFQAAGENLAYAPNVQVAHTGLMNSPGHRANILSTDFGKVGIGVIDAGVYGKMFVQEFTN